MIQEVESFQDYHNELEEEKKMDRSKAISILEVKWSTFCSLVHSKKKQEASLLLGHALVEKTHEWRQNGFLASDQYNPYGGVSDVSVIHEAYQFLIDCIEEEEKKYQSLLVSTNNLTDSNWDKLKHKYFLKITGSSEEENMETKRKTEEVITALQNMPSLGEELVRETRRTKSFYDIARRTIKAIKEPTENRRGSEQLEHSATKVFVEESSKKKKNTMDFLKALAILKVNPRELKKKILEVGCEEAKEMLGEAVGEQTRAFRKNGNILQIKGFEETQDVSLFHEAYQYLVTECIEKKDVKNLTDVIEGRYVSAAKLQARKAEKDFNMELKQVADLTETEKLLENTEELIGLKPKGSVKSKKQTRGLIDEITPKVESMSLKDKKSSSRDNKSSKGYNQAKETTKKKGSMKKKK